MSYAQVTKALRLFYFPGNKYSCLPPPPLYLCDKWSLKSLILNKIKIITYSSHVGLCWAGNIVFKEYDVLNSISNFHVGNKHLSEFFNEYILHWTKNFSMNFPHRYYKLGVIVFIVLMTCCLCGVNHITEIIQTGFRFGPFVQMSFKITYYNCNHLFATNKQQFIVHPPTPPTCV